MRQGEQARDDVWVEGHREPGGKPPLPWSPEDRGEPEKAGRGAGGGEGAQGPLPWRLQGERGPANIFTGGHVPSSTAGEYT